MPWTGNDEKMQLVTALGSYVYTNTVIVCTAVLGADIKQLFAKTNRFKNSLSVLL